MKDKIIAILLCAVMLASGTLLALQVEKSRIYQQSRLLRAVLDQESVGLAEILTDRRNFRMLRSFAGAAVSAYINFELIPVHEAQKFAVIFDSLGDGMEIDTFEYRGRDLILRGAATQEEYQEFVARLQGRVNIAENEHFVADGEERFMIVISPA